PVVTPEAVIVATIDGELLALDKTSGQVRWHFKSPDFQWSILDQPQLADGVVYWTAGDDRLYALSADHGDVIWSVPCPEAGRDILVTGTRVHVPSDMLRVFARSNGQSIAAVRVAVPGDAIESQPQAIGSRIFVSESSAIWSFREP
ncbi:MAG TPA: PQQ-binding-like beta-propeller repeat protein, partial [Gemmatimonadaceae bacterium]|nr:PQQ-binding-like beta-propeller repeat protein [Gemmatimonadaceae bacterium]